VGEYGGCGHARHISSTCGPPRPLKPRAADADVVPVTARLASLSDLTRLGAGALEQHVERTHPPSTPLEWLGIAVGGLPELTARARTVDGVHRRSRTQNVALHAPLLDALMSSLG